MDTNNAKDTKTASTAVSIDKSKLHGRASRACNSFHFLPADEQASNLQLTRTR